MMFWLILIFIYVYNIVCMGFVCLKKKLILWNGTVYGIYSDENYLGKMIKCS